LEGEKLFFWQDDRDGVPLRREVFVQQRRDLLLADPLQDCGIPEKFGIPEKIGQEVVGDKLKGVEAAHVLAEQLAPVALEIGRAHV